ncbi:probable E3 ubiquitin-protein ligase TRIML1 isoform X2 [Hippocampus comes]|uniref:probable E3 ubiquitin-protein ligase TRIML1 isoform X2 n=1 Tax=Hippocampus comes TaxID=109280 RepID=UPI00094E62C3|nr:PREDICTED: probable E3 ubiquitin-protein ligase TRIML1 isoform X2 [Hippocampus comes]
MNIFIHLRILHVQHLHCSLQELLKSHQECLRMQREVVKDRQKNLAEQQSEIIESIIRKHLEIRAILDEDLRTTLSHLEAEERAAVSALDWLMERNWSLIREIEQDLAGITVTLDHQDLPSHEMSDHQGAGVIDRVAAALSRFECCSVSLDATKAEQILSLTNNMLLLISSLTPTMKNLMKSYSSDVCLDPDTAHPKLLISPKGDSVTYTDTWKELPDAPSRFDTTLNVISLQSFSSGRHYWEMDVTGKTYWELGVTYPSIPRKGIAEDCWLGRGDESWCVEFFGGEYTAWHRGVPHRLLVPKQFCRIGILCNFPAASVMFLGADDMSPLFCFSAGNFSDSLHLALCPGHDHNGTNAKPIVICNATPPAPHI